MATKRIKIGLIPLIFVTNIALGISPALGTIKHHFPETSATKLQLIVSVGALFGFLASLIAGKFQTYLSQKKVLIIGAGLLSLGILPAFLPSNLNFLIVISVVTGSGGGLLTATIPAVISRYFKGTDQTSMFGRKTSVQGLGTMSLTFISGLLATYRWQNSYLIFGLAFLALVLGVFFLPKDNEVKIVSNQQSEKPPLLSKSHLSFPWHDKTIYFLLSMVTSLTIVSGTLANNMALHAEAHSLGNASIAGLALSSQSLGIILAGFSVKTIIAKLERRTLISGFTLVGVGLGTLAFVYHLWGMLFGAFVFGFGYGILLTRLLFLMSKVVLPSAVPVGMSLIAAAMSFGFALSPVLFNPLSAFFSLNSATMTFVLACFFSVIIVIILGISRFEKRVLMS